MASHVTQSKSQKWFGSYYLSDFSPSILHLALSATPTLASLLWLGHKRQIPPSGRLQWLPPPQGKFSPNTCMDHPSISSFRPTNPFILHYYFLQNLLSSKTSCNWLSYVVWFLSTRMQVGNFEFCSLMCIKCLEKCLAHNKCSINTVE